MLKNINKTIITFIMLIACFFVFVEPVNAVKGPLDGLNVSMEIDTSTGKADLTGSFSGDATKDADINSGKENFGTFTFDNLRSIIFAGFGIATLTMVLFAILNFIKLGQSADNPQERSQALKSLMHCGIAAALLGGITVIVGVSIGLFQ